MNLNRKEYISKVRGCFIGKNIGGTIGGPFEGAREILDIKGFTTKPGEPLPNDDLDLQLIWLVALEEEGPRYINSEVLSNYWNAYQIMPVNEYGIAKNNINNGFKASIAGDMENNIWKDSNGAWIRTEVWATLCPGAVDNAVSYAIEDAKVDHGFGEGTHAAMFVAALESAAFFESDIEKLIDIGLSKVCKESILHKTISLVRSEYKKGTPWKDVRNKVVDLNKDLRNGWFQAPNNIAYVVIGLLYGELDFKKSMLIAVNCGDDTDCTAATVGSILGIIYGEEKIPNDWKEYIGDSIKSLAINPCIFFQGPQTITDLVERIAFQAPFVLRTNHAKVTISDEPTSITKEEKDAFLNEYGYMDERDVIRASKYSFKPNTFKQHTGTVTTIVTYKNGVSFEVGEEKEIEVMVTNNIKAYGNSPRNVDLELILPNGANSKSFSKGLYAPSWTYMTQMTYSEPVTFKFKFEGQRSSTETVLLKVSVQCDGNEYYVPVKFYQK